MLRTPCIRLTHNTQYTVVWVGRTPQRPCDALAAVLQTNVAYTSNPLPLRGGSPIFVQDTKSWISSLGPYEKCGRRLISSLPGEDVMRWVLMTEDASE